MAETTAPTAMAERRWRWTAEAYEKAADMGLFGPDPRVELLEGEVIAKLPMHPPHSTVLGILNELVLVQLDRSLWTVRCQSPIRLNDISEPEPDLWVARGAQRTYGRRHPVPADLLLVVEVAGSYPADDRREKIPLYAGAGVPSAWLVSPPEKTLTVYRQPSPSARRYDQETVLRPGDIAAHPPTGLTLTLTELF